VGGLIVEESACVKGFQTNPALLLGPLSKQAVPTQQGATHPTLYSTHISLYHSTISWGLGLCACSSITLDGGDKPGVAVGWLTAL